MAKYVVKYKKEYEDKVESFSVEKEAKKPYEAKREVQSGCKRESYELWERLQEEIPRALGCGNYGKDDIGVWTTKGSSSPLSSTPRKEKWILRFFDFEVEEITVLDGND